MHTHTQIRICTHAYVHTSEHVHAYIKQREKNKYFIYAQLKRQDISEILHSIIY